MRWKMHWTFFNRLKTLSNTLLLFSNALAMFPNALAMFDNTLKFAWTTHCKLHLTPAWNCLQATPNSLAFFLEIFQSERKQSENKKQLIPLPRDEVSRRCERKMKVVNLKEGKNKPIILRSVVFQLCLVNGHLFLFLAVL